MSLSKKLSEGTMKVHQHLVKTLDCAIDVDEAGSIGKRYRRYDEIGTPWCVTYDFDSENDNAVTVRDRDTMKQERIAIDALEGYFREKLRF